MRLLLLALALFFVAAVKGLTLAPDGTFRIMQLTDLHYGEGSEKDANSSTAMAAMLEAEKPDLVVLSGDMVSGFACTLTESQALLLTFGTSSQYQVGPGADTGICPDGWYAGSWTNITAPLKAAGVPWASILGNHDDEGDLNRTAILANDIATGNGLSLTQQGPSNITGASNYYIDILGGDGSVAARVWFLDSMDRGCEGQAGAGCVASNTVAWFKATAASLPSVPSVLFVHIPIPEIMEAWTNGTDVVGGKGEPSECQAVNTGVFAAAREAGVLAIYSGHDHDNDFSAIVDGISVGYGRKSGYGSYGPPAGMAHGARVVELSADATSAEDIVTWIREETGSKVEQGPAAASSNQDAQDQDVCPTGSTYCAALPSAGSCQAEQKIIAAGKASAPAPAPESAAHAAGGRRLKSVLVW